MAMKLVKRLNRVRIASRLAVMIALIMVFSMGLVAYWSYDNLAALSLASARSDAAYLVQSIARSVVVSMFDEHAGNRQQLHKALEEAIDPFSRREDILSVLVADHSGHVMFSTDLKYQVGQTISQTKHVACVSCHNQSENNDMLDQTNNPISAEVYRPSQVVRASGPIFNSAGCSTAACHFHSPDQLVLGAIAIEQNIKPVITELNRARRSLILVTVLMSLAGPMLTLVLLRSWLDRPVQELIQGMDRVAAGNLDAKLASAEGELGHLAHTFNRMQVKLQNSQRQLIQSEKMASLGKIAAGVAHEINNPLTGILAYSEDLIDEADQDDPLLNDYKVIYRETIRCREIVRNLLDFARHGEPQMEPTDINKVIMRTVELVSHLASFQNLTINEDLHDDLPMVMADPGQLQQVFLNFMVNAAEAMPSGGEIQLITRLRRDGRGIVASVADQGVGIPKEMIDHIFEPFFSTKGGKTTGLGLSVSWGIIEKHQGRIEVQSEKDKGTVFRVYLPLTN